MAEAKKKTTTKRVSSRGKAAPATKVDAGVELAGFTPDKPFSHSLFVKACQRGAAAFHGLAELDPADGDAAQAKEILERARQAVARANEQMKRLG